MNPVCESHNPKADREPEEAEGDCAVATPGGEQPEAQAWSQTDQQRSVNSIRPELRASLRSEGEACLETDDPTTAQELSRLDAGRNGGVWSGNVWKGPWLTIRERRGGLSRGAVRAPIVATKPGNAGGAKGCRKAKAQ